MFLFKNGGCCDEVFASWIGNFTREFDFFLDTEEVTGSNPVLPILKTVFSKNPEGSDCFPSTKDDPPDHQSGGFCFEVTASAPGCRHRFPRPDRLGTQAVRRRLDSRQRVSPHCASLVRLLPCRLFCLFGGANAVQEHGRAV